MGDFYFHFMPLCILIYAYYYFHNLILKFLLGLMMLFRTAVVIDDLHKASGVHVVWHEVDAS